MERGVKRKNAKVTWRPKGARVRMSWRRDAGEAEGGKREEGIERQPCREGWEEKQGVRGGCRCRTRKSEAPDERRAR